MSLNGSIDDSTNGRKVAVIGAGPLGLAAIKNLTEDGFDVTGYEARGYVGGLWKYSTDSSISVAANTIFNSSKYRSAFSDFPMRGDMEDFPTGEQIWHYLDSYADHFNLKPKVRLNSRVRHVHREGNKWAVEYAKDGSPSEIDYYDKVLISVGTFVEPHKPALDGIDRFEGKVIHSVEFHDPEKFAGKNVLILGTHASGIDVALGLAGHTSQIYMAHRHGVIMVGRYTPDGRTFDQGQNLRMTYIFNFLMAWFPNFFSWFINMAIKSMAKKSFIVPESWGFSNPPSMLVTPPIIADEIFPLFESGQAKPVSSVKCITGPKTIRLTDGRVLEDIDAIIYCTGYKSNVDFLEERYDPFNRKNRDQVPRLYRNIFPLSDDAAIRNSLAFLGLAATLFPGFVQFELGGMAVSQTWLGNSPLPSLPEMEAYFDHYLQWRRNQLKGESPNANFYLAFVPGHEHLEWLDRTAGCGVGDNLGGWGLGAFCGGCLSWKTWKLWWQDKELYRMCVNGLATPAIWRLFDTGKRKVWKGARQEVFRANKVANTEAKKKLEQMDKKKK
ncbi:hypothetical protein H2203_006964 [Taxawa tesnikishii (nom. ined.)]|nr:hypothetical protein H2203_006964 [Dothideales sp. JES 119]